jgi:N-acetylglucosaminyldiphosphoundecaprenol N-acetyl-beta-D-mannosaminyltransferase
LLNVQIDNLTQLELLEALRSGGTVFTTNVAHLVLLQQQPEFYYAYQSADYQTCDSQLVWFAAKLLGIPIREKISGSDLFPAFYYYFAKDPSTTIFLLGAAPGVAHRARAKINQQVGRTIVTAAHSPSFGFEKNASECDHLIAMIHASGATVLAIGVGTPKQELWIAQHKHRLPRVKTFLAIGATIDFEAGNVQRAPKWISDVGLEWFYRLLKEPQRLWKRYLGDALPFAMLIWQQATHRYQNPWRVDAHPQLDDDGPQSAVASGQKPRKTVLVQN